MIRGNHDREQSRKNQRVTFQVAPGVEIKNSCGFFAHLVGRSGLSALARQAVSVKLHVRNGNLTVAYRCCCQCNADR